MTLTRPVAAVALLALSCAFAAAQDLSVAVTGNAITLSGAPAPGVPLRCVIYGDGKVADTIAASTDDKGLFSFRLTHSVRNSFRIEVDPTPDGKLAPCAFLARQESALPFDRDMNVTICLAPATSRISGTVTGDDGKPIPGAVLNLAFGDFRCCSTRTVTAGPDGKYAIDRLAQGRYTFRSVIPPAGSTAVRLDTWKPFGVAHVDLAADTAATQDFKLPRGARLLGRVLDEAGKPVSAVPVACSTDSATEVGPRNVYQMPGQWYSAEAVTDADGRYALASLTQETYRVTVRPPSASGFAPATLRGVNAMNAADASLQDITLRPAASLTGVITGDDGKPVANAALSLTTAEVRERFGFSPPSIAATSDDAGRFTIPALASGRFSLTVIPPPGSPLAKKTFDDLTTVAGLALLCNVALERGAAVDGVVLDPTGKPVPGSTVIIGHGYENVASLVTDKDGRFSCVGIAQPAKPEKWRVLAIAPDAFPHADNVQIELAQLPPGKTTPVTLNLKPAAAASGTVLDSAGKPVAGARVTVYRAMGQYGSTSAYPTTSGPDGRYLLGHIQPGPWTFAVWPPEGSNLLTLSLGPHDFTAGRTADLDLTLKAAATVLGKVLGPDGKPLAAATLRIQLGRNTGVAIPGFQQSTPVAFTGADGSFRLPGVPTGTHDLICTPLNPNLRIEPSKVTTNGTGEAAVTLNAEELGSVSGLVLDSARKPLPKGFVYVNLRPSRGNGASAAPDDAGRFTLPGISPGKHSVVVNVAKPGLDAGLAQPDPTPVTVEANVDSKIEIIVPTRQPKP